MALEATLLQMFNLPTAFALNQMKLKVSTGKPTAVGIFSHENLQVDAADQQKVDVKQHVESRSVQLYLFSVKRTRRPHSSTVSSQSLPL